MAHRLAAGESLSRSLKRKSSVDFATCKLGLFGSNARPFNALGVCLRVVCLCVCWGHCDFLDISDWGSQQPISRWRDVHWKQKEIQLFSLEITSEYISQISKQTHCKIFNTCDFGIILNLIIKLRLVQVLQLFIYQSLISVRTLAQLWALCRTLETSAAACGCTTDVADSISNTRSTLIAA